MLADSGHRYHTLNIPYQTNHQNFGSLSQAFHENEKKKPLLSIKSSNAATILDAKKLPDASAATPYA